ncbi:MAG TPA: hypothetical protein O0X39_01160 [Methanocorpusculum sp.]|nr:hypothetical protein [Methanocorpusculum sp.]
MRHTAFEQTLLHILENRKGKYEYTSEVGRKLQIYLTKREDRFERLTETQEQIIEEIIKLIETEVQAGRTP